MDGVNYLVPVDARLERDVDVRFETLTVDDLLISTAGASLRLVILDACRNNPLARSMQRPHEYHSLVGEHYLTRTLAAGTSVNPRLPRDPGPASSCRRAGREEIRPLWR